MIDDNDTVFDIEFSDIDDYELLTKTIDKVIIDEEFIEAGFTMFDDSYE